MDTKKYYKEKHQEFIDRTLDLDMSFHYQKFESYFLGGKLLDLGFGSGRDSKYFSTKYEVVSGDIVEEFLENGRNFLKNEVRYIDAVHMDITEEFDAVWACASLLHISSKDLEKVFQNVYKALKENGLLYCSFKYGEFEGVRNNRFFNDFYEEKFERFYPEKLFSIIETYKSIDTRPGKDGEFWFNVILRRK